MRIFRTKKLPELLAFSLLVGVASILLTARPAAAADYSNSHMMDDGVFENVGSMTPNNSSPSVAQLQTVIQNFLNGQGVALSNGGTATLSGGSTCVKNYSDVEATFNGSTWSYSGSIPASKVIAEASLQWGLNPEVILSTLEKEESLVSGTSCDSWRYQSAMGYGCPDSGGCSSKYAGFTHQVLWGAWQLKFNEQRSYGNTAWDGDGDITYTGYMTQGSRARCDSCQSFTYDGNATIDGQTIHLDNGTTASLYTYTPHLNQSFPGIFEQWFGSVRVPTYDWAIQSQYAYTDQTKSTGYRTTGLLPGDVVYVGVRALNTGNTTWTGGGTNPVHLGTWSPQDRDSAFCDGWVLGCNRPAWMQESSVAPGQVGTFEFWIKAPNAPGAYNEHFNLVAEGAQWMNDTGMNFYITVSKPVYAWQPVGQYAYTDQTKTVGTGTTGMLPGDAVYVGVEAKNTGNMTWRASGANPTHLGTSSPNDRSSAFCDGWAGCNRPAYLQQASVAPGQTGTFEFWMKAPSVPGTYIEHFTPVVEGVTWMNDPGFSFYMTVLQPVYSWQLTSQFAYTNQNMTTGASTLGLHPGNKVWVGFTAKNTGTVTWHNDGANPVNVGMTHPLDRYSLFYDSSWLGYNRPAHLLESSVAPGQSGTFEFWMDAPSQSGTYREYFSLVSEHAAWFNDPLMNFYMTVAP